MNSYIHIALIFWTLLLAVNRFQWACIDKAESESFWLNALLSFLSLFTALLSIGEYIR